MDRPEMTFLSTIDLAAHKQADAVLRDVQRMHSMIFEAALTGETPRRVLWAHLEERTLVVRHTRPIESRDLPQGLVARTSATKETSAENGQRIELAWVMNPARRKTVQGVRHGTKVVPASEWDAFAAVRLAPMIDIETLSTRNGGKAHGRHADGNNPTIQRVIVRATGTVTDANTLNERMISGLGHARAYGCGLIVARKASP